MRRRHGACVALTFVALTTACAVELPEPSPDPVGADRGPAVSVDQVERVLTEVGETLAEADEDRSTSAVGARVDGPARVTRHAEYVLTAAGAEDAITAVPTTAQTVIAPVEEGWPRVVMVVSEPPEDLQAPLLLTLVQPSPREQYRLWAWSRLFPGVQMPATAQPELGSEQLAMDDDSLVVPPGEVITAYVDLLTEGEDSEYADVFAEDPLRQNIVQTREAYEELTAETGEMEERYEQARTGPYAIRTADGGALVVGAFRTYTTITLEDSTLTIGDQTSAFLRGTSELSEELRITWMSMASFYVPPVGSEQQIQMLGAEHGRATAEGS